MEKLMPIIPGCKALMLATDFQHRPGGALISLPVHEVTVVDRCPALDDIYACPKCAAKNFWFVHSPMLNLPPLSGLANCACQLIRIDGGDFRLEGEQFGITLGRMSAPSARRLEKIRLDAWRDSRLRRDQLRRNFG